MKKLAILLCLAAVALSSCGRKYKLHRDEISSEGIWPYIHGDLAARGAVSSREFNGQLNVIWEASTRGKPAGPLTLYNNTLLFPETRKRIDFYDFYTGQFRGRIKTKGVAMSGVVVQDSLAFFAVAPRRNRLYGFNLLRRKTIWDRPLRDAQAGPIIVDNRLLVSSGAGVLEAYSPDDGNESWQFKADCMFSASASYANHRLFQPADKGVLYALSAETGQEFYKVELKGPIVSVVAVDEFVYVADVLGNVYALEPNDGSIVWQRQLNGPIWTSPAVADGRVFIGHSGGEVVALDAEKGTELWRYPAVDVIKASPVVVGRFLVVATLRGRVLVLKTDDGALVSEAEVEGPIEYSPVTDGKRLIVVTQKGKLVCYGEDNEHPSLADQRVDSQHEP